MNDHPTNEPNPDDADSADKGLSKLGQRNLANSGIFTRACFLFYCLAFVFVLTSFRLPEELPATSGTISRGESNKSGLTFIDREAGNSTNGIREPNSGGDKETRQTGGDKGGEGLNLAEDASPIGTWRISRYYTPERGQDKYFHGSYEQDYYINCQGDCTITADGTDLTQEEPFTVVACPRYESGHLRLEFGTKLYIEGIGEVVCHDTGGAIIGNRLDLWAGIGQEGLDNIYNNPQMSGWKKIYVIE